MRHYYNEAGVCVHTGHSRRFVEWRRREMRKKTSPYFRQRMDKPIVKRPRRKHYDLAVETLKKLTGDGADNYAVVYEDGTTFVRNGAPCLAALGYGPDRPRKGRKALWFLDRVQKPVGYGWITEDMVVRYLNWLANESPYAKAFVSKNGKDMYLNGAIFNTREPAQLVCGAAIQYRHIREKPNKVFFWNAMVKDRDKPNIKACALFVSGGFYPKGAGNDRDPNEFSWACQSCGHEALDQSNMTKRGLRRYLNGEQVNFGRDGKRVPMEDRLEYSPICMSWVQFKEVPRDNAEMQRIHGGIWMPTDGPRVVYPQPKEVKEQNAFGAPAMRKVYTKTPRHFLKEFMKLNGVKP